MKKIEKYFSKHVYCNSSIHVIAGLGLGALLTHTMFDPHPVRWAVVFLVIAVIGHWWAYSKAGK